MTVWLDEGARERMVTLGQRFHPLETGGVLLGWRDGGDRVIVDVIGPGPLALHGRHLFLPDHAWQVQQIKDVFRLTNGDLDYLGDWHTHPSGLAEMSGQDRKTIVRLNCRVRGALMIIAAGEGAEWRLGAWSQGPRKLFAPTILEQRDLRLFSAPENWPRAMGYA